MKPATFLACAAAVAAAAGGPHAAETANHRAASVPAAVFNTTHLARDFSCCAFWRQDGNYFSGIRLLGAPATSSGPDGEGWVATAPGVFSVVIGKCPVDLDRSYSGMHVFGCTSSGKAKVVSWHRGGGKGGGKCKLSTWRQVPEMCFGGQGYYPNYRDTYRMGAFTHLTRFDDLDGFGTISINPISCAPYLLEMKAGKHDHDHQQHQQDQQDDDGDCGAATTYGSGKPLCGPKFGVVFLNASGNAAPAGIFGYPSWCIKQLEAEHGEDWRTC